MHSSISFWNMLITIKLRGSGLGALKHLAFKNTLEMFHEDFCSAFGPA